VADDDVIVTVLLSSLDAKREPDGRAVFGGDEYTLSIPREVWVKAGQPMELSFRLPAGAA
jgi:hypothetical protein